MLCSKKELFYNLEHITPFNKQSMKCFSSKFSLKTCLGETKKNKMSCTLNESRTKKNVFFKAQNILIGLNLVFVKFNNC